VNAPGVGCGAAILRDGRVLLVKRLRPPEAGCWSLPGGKVDFGERIVDAIRREVAEEIGVTIAPTRPLGLIEAIGIDGQHWVSPIYQAEIVAGEPYNREPEKHAAIAWASLEAPPEPLALPAREAISRLRDLFP